MIDKKDIQNAVKELHGQTRKFSQSYDLIVALKDIDLKKEAVEFFATLPNHPKRKTAVCALVGPEMIDQARDEADFAVSQSEFDKLEKKDVRKLANNHDYFIGQANIMPKIAQSFGRILGPRGKMPNPKAGCIIPPKAPIKPVVQRLQKLVKVSAKQSPSIQVRIASQENSEEEAVQNIVSVYDQIIHHLPKEENNIKAVYLKLTMSEPVRLR